MNMGIKFSSGSRRTRTEGQGEVVDISSSGVAFRTAAPLAPGSAIQATMSWPVTLNGDCLLRITMEGRVVRTTEDGLAVMTLERYEFRTCGRVAAPRVDVEAAKRGFASLSGASGTRAFA
jgi:hypothetical protein